MPASSAPSFSFATARMALPVSVRVMSQPQRQCNDKHHGEGNEPRNGDEGENQVHSLERIRKIDGARVGTECVEKRVFDQHRQAKRHQQHGALVAARSRADHQALQGVAEAEERRRQKRTAR